MHTVVYNLTDSLGAAYETQFSIRYNGASGVLLTPQDFVTIEEGIMINAILQWNTVGGNMVGTVTGLAGKTIHWLVSGTYIYVS